MYTLYEVRLVTEGRRVFGDGYKTFEGWGEYKIVASTPELALAKAKEEHLRCDSLITFTSSSVSKITYVHFIAE